MANHQVPRKAHRIEQVHGIDADGNVVTAVVFRHVREGHTVPMFYVVQYRERNRRIESASRVTREFFGPQAAARTEEAMTEVRELLEASRVRAAGMLVRS
jgi:hypothetical protein